MTPLTDRRIRGDIIEMYKITKGHEGIEWVNASRIRSDLDLNGQINEVTDYNQRI